MVKLVGPLISHNPNMIEKKRKRRVTWMASDVCIILSCLIMAVSDTNVLSHI